MSRRAAAAAEVIPDAVRADVVTLWRYHDLRHELRSCDVGIGLGSHDLGVAVVATRLFHEGLFPRIVFTGANAPTTVGRFPRGEAVHYREYAVEQGVPAGAILVEPRATNTAENLEFSRALLAERRIPVESVLIMSRPYQQRRAYATCRLMWPEVEVVCASNPLELDDYVRSIGDGVRFFLSEVVVWFMRPGRVGLCSGWCGCVGARVGGGSASTGRSRRWR